MSQLNDDQLQPIPIEEFVILPSIVVDTYIRLSKNKFVLIAKSGQPTPVEKMQKYRERSTECLYVRVEDYQQFLIQARLNKQGEQIKVSEEKATSLQFLQTAMTDVYRDILELGFDDDTYARARLVNHTAMGFFRDNPSLPELIEKAGRVSHEGVAHAMMVSLVSVMIGQNHDWARPATLEKLALGGFLHDVGKSTLPPEIADKQQEKMNRDERIIYQSHVEAGKQILSRVKSVPEDVVLIVAEHHERADGSGFPMGLKDFQMSPLARVVALANVFVNRIAAEERPLNGMIARNVLQEIEIHHSMHFNREALKALAKCLETKGLGRAAS